VAILCSRGLVHVKVLFLAINELIVGRSDRAEENRHDDPNHAVERVAERRVRHGGDNYGNDVN